MNETLLIDLLTFTIASITGGWMIIDGTYAMRYRKYFGPTSNSHWVYIVKKVGIEPLAMSKLFIFLGFLWIFTTFLLLISGFEELWLFLLVIAFSTLWYLPLGTILSVVEIILLVVFKTNFLFTT